MGWPTGFEPATTSSTSLDSTIELWPPADEQVKRSERGRQGTLSPRKAEEVPPGRAKEEVQGVAQLLVV